MQRAHHLAVADIRHDPRERPVGPTQPFQACAAVRSQPATTGSTRRTSSCPILIRLTLHRRAQPDSLEPFQRAARPNGGALSTGALNGKTPQYAGFCFASEGALGWLRPPAPAVCL